MSDPHIYNLKLCGCGSGLEPEWLYDARGIELCKACPSCREERILAYRPEVLTDPNYEASEDIEGDGDDVAPEEDIFDE